MQAAATPEPESIYFFIWIDDADHVDQREPTENGEQRSEQVHRRFHAVPPRIQNRKNPLGIWNTARTIHPVIKSSQSAVVRVTWP